MCLLSGRFNEVLASCEDAAMSLVKPFGWPCHDNQLRLRERGCSSGLVGGSTIVVEGIRRQTPAEMSGGGRNSRGDVAYLMLKRPSLGGCVHRAWAKLEKAKINFVKTPIRSTGIGASVAHRDKYPSRATRMSLGKWLMYLHYLVPWAHPSLPDPCDKR